MKLKRVFQIDKFFIASSRLCAINSRVYSLPIIVAVALCGFTARPTCAQPDSKPAAKSSGTSNSGALAGLVVAQVNDTPVNRSEVDKAVEQMTQGRAIEPAALPEIQAQALSQIIDQRILLEYLTRNKLTAATTQIEAKIDELRAALKQQNVSLEQRLTQTGQSMAILRAQLGTELSLQKFVQSSADEQSLNAFYKTNARHFDGTQLRVSHVLLRPTQSGNQPETAELIKQAENIKQQIEANKLTFAAAAEKYSDGPSRRQAGDLGFIGREGPMVDAFNRATFQLAPKEISPPTATPFGIHLITVTEVKAGKKTLEDVKSKVVQALAQELVQKLMAEERTKAKVVFNERFPHFKLGTRELVMPR